MCCKVLVIDHFEKDAGVLCAHCALKSGCTIYATRPQICRDYECEWMSDRSLGPQMRPDRIGTIFQEDPETEEYQAVVDPATPMAWRNPMIFRHLVAQAKAGRVVVAKSGAKTWRIFESGEVAVWT